MHSREGAASEDLDEGALEVRRKRLSMTRSNDEINFTVHLEETEIRSLDATRKSQRGGSARLEGYRLSGSEDYVACSKDPTVGKQTTGRRTQCFGDRETRRFNVLGSGRASVLARRRMDEGRGVRSEKSERIDKRFGKGRIKSVHTNAPCNCVILGRALLVRGAAVISIAETTIGAMKSVSWLSDGAAFSEVLWPWIIPVDAGSEKVSLAPWKTGCGGRGHFRVPVAHVMEWLTQSPFHRVKSGKADKADARQRQAIPRDAVSDIGPLCRKVIPGVSVGGQRTTGEHKCRDR
ncbi:hypothetical protein F5146DRAFT_998933 [Armillaria mellea]|nr:hypothetical protein F5146DRAFT_998933 [Armillaria mellea]